MLEGAGVGVAGTVVEVRVEDCTGAAGGAGVPTFAGAGVDGGLAEAEEDATGVLAGAALGYRW